MRKYLPIITMICLSISLIGQDKKAAGTQFLDSHKAELGISDSDIRNAVIADMYQSKHNGVTHIYYNQAYKGIPVYNAILNLNITEEDEVLFYHNGFIPELESKVNTGKSLVRAQDAIQSSALYLGIEKPDQATMLKTGDRGELVFSPTNFSKGEIRARQVFFPLTDNDVRLAWEVSFAQKNSSDTWSSKVDAVSGQVIELENRTVYCEHTPGQYQKHGPSCIGHDHAEAEVQLSETHSSMMSASYRVYPVPLESPVHGPQELVTDPHDPTASPFGWHDMDGVEGPEFTITRGNNVHAYNDADNDGASLDDEPDGGADLIFDIAHDTSLEPDFNRDADVVNLFYANNMIHDITYLMGFDEESGNFQANNYGKGGLDSDFVIAHSLDGSGVNNANFSLAPDGINGNMNMFRWSIPQSRLFSVLEPVELVRDYQNGAAGDGWGFDETYASYDIEAELAMIQIRSMPTMYVALWLTLKRLKVRLL